jgi:regulator of replication initiation timing
MRELELERDVDAATIQAMETELRNRIEENAMLRGQVSQLHSNLEAALGRLAERNTAKPTVQRKRAGGPTKARKKQDADPEARDDIHNVRARLKPTPSIPSVETDLTVSETPVADAGRYDQLRAQKVDHA